MRFGLHTGPQHCTFADLRHLWRRADESGFWWVSVWDHLHPAQAASDGPCFETVSTHAALAALTTNVRVGCLVYCAAYRHPAVLAKAAVTIDHISDGRAELGLGAGWHEEEFEAHGIPFLPPGQRLAQLDESAQVIRSMWHDGRVTLEGEHVTAVDVVCNPRMVQESPRLWIGALGDRALQLTARRADGWNAAFLGPHPWSVRNEALTRHAEAVGRDPASIMRSVNLGLVLGADAAEVADRRERLGEQFGSAAEYVEQGSLAGTPSEVIDRIGTYADAGADLIVVALRAPFDLDALELFIAEVMPAFT